MDVDDVARADDAGIVEIAGRVAGLTNTPRDRQPRMAGGPGRGMPNQRQPMPTQIGRSKPMASFIWTPG